MASLKWSKVTFSLPDPTSVVEIILLRDKLISVDVVLNGLDGG